LFVHSADAEYNGNEQMSKMNEHTYTLHCSCIVVITQVNLDFVGAVLLPVYAYRHGVSTNPAQSTSSRYPGYIFKLHNIIMQVKSVMCINEHVVMNSNVPSVL